MADWLLVHPPLLGPAVLRPLADELRARGLSVAAPDLRGTVTTAGGWPARWIEAAAAGRAEVVVGFSGAGPTLPGIAAAVGARRVVWLDAPMPARSGATLPSAEVRALVAPLVHGDRISEWTTWWGPGALAEMVADPVLRGAIEAEGHELPADFYDVAVPLPTAWPEDGARYVQLSQAYDADAAEAAARGWPVAGGSGGNHLDVVTEPPRIADLLG